MNIDMGELISKCAGFLNSCVLSLYLVCSPFFVLIKAQTSNPQKILDGRDIFQFWHKYTLHRLTWHFLNVYCLKDKLLENVLQLYLDVILALSESLERTVVVKLMKSTLKINKVSPY